jgi:hypothetical protein
VVRILRRRFGRCAELSCDDLKGPMESHQPSVRGFLGLAVLAACALSMGAASNGPRSKSLRIDLLDTSRTIKTPIKVRLVNSGSQSAFFCVSTCGSVLAPWIVPEIGWKAIPRFDIQMHGRRGWGSQMWGCDVGALDFNYELAAGKSMDFGAWLKEPGKYRLKLQYSNLDHGPKCSAETQRGSAVASITFDVL